MSKGVKQIRERVIHAAIRGKKIPCRESGKYKGTSRGGEHACLRIAEPQKAPWWASGEAVGYDVTEIMVRVGGSVLPSRQL